MMSYTISQCSAAVAGGVCIRSAIHGPVKKCPPNTTNINTRGRSAAWCHPKPGYYGLRGTAATICPVDFFCPSVAVLPIPCPSRRFAVQGSSLCIPEMMPPCRDGWYLPWSLGLAWRAEPGLARCLPCPRGFYCNEDRINACEGGDGPEEASTQSACTYLSTLPATCPDNMQRRGSEAACRPMAGFFYATPDVAVACPRHYFCPAGWAIACPAAVDKCGIGEAAVAVRCPAGSARPLDACAPCEPLENAYYTTENSCSTAEVCCNAGYYFSYYAFAANASAACVRRPAECQVRNVAALVPEYPACTVGTLPCILCSAMEGATSIAVVENKCVYTCKAGYVALQTGCQPCPYGSYLPTTTTVYFNTSSSYVNNASTACQNCSFGYYTPQYAATACSECPRGTVGDGDGGCVICPSGKYFYHDFGTLPKCRNGFYRPKPWAECQECAAGSVILHSIDGADCVACPPGTSTLGVSADACTPCMAYEEYMPYSGATACLQCTLEMCGCRDGSCFINGTCVACVKNTTTPARQACPAPSFISRDICACPRLFYFSTELHLCVPCSECAPEANTISVCDGFTTSDVTTCACTSSNDTYIGFICHI